MIRHGDSRDDELQSDLCISRRRLSLEVDEQIAHWDSDREKRGTKRIDNLLTPTDATTPSNVAEERV